MDFWTGIFEYDLQTEPGTADDCTDFNFEICISEIFATDENGDFLCAGDDFAEYISIKRRAGTWL